MPLAELLWKANHEAPVVLWSEREERWLIVTFTGWFRLRVADPAHPVLAQLPGFLAHTTDVTELRLRRLGLLDRPLTELGRPRRAALMARALARRALARIVPRRERLLTDTYLADPLLSGSASGAQDRTLDPDP